MEANMEKFYMIIDARTMRICTVTKDLILATRYAQEMTDEWWRFSGAEIDLHIYEANEIKL